MWNKKCTLQVINLLVELWKKFTNNLKVQLKLFWQLCATADSAEMSAQREQGRERLSATLAAVYQFIHLNLFKTSFIWKKLVKLPGLKKKKEKKKIRCTLVIYLNSLSSCLCPKSILWVSTDWIILESPVLSVGALKLAQCIVQKIMYDV